MTDLLDDLRVVSFAQLAQGPFAAQILGELGADVVKIEPPGGEWMRADPDLEAGEQAGLNTVLDGDNLSFLAVNRSKRGIELDLKAERDREVAYELVDMADVLIENFRPGVMDRLGFGYDTLADRNPGLVYCSSSGYGRSGPYAGRPAQDLLIQALSGVMSITGHAEDPPTPVGTTVADTYAAMQVVIGVLAALQRRTRTGEGARIDVDMLSSAVHLLSQEIVVNKNSGEPPQRTTEGMGHVYLQAPYGVYETADGYLAISLTPVAALGEALDIDELKNINKLSESYRRRTEIQARIAAVLKTEPTDQWEDTLLAADVWCARVQSLSAVANDPQVMANEMIQTVTRGGESIDVVSLPFRIDGETPTAGSPPPRVGEHTAAILDELGYPDGYLDEETNET